VKLIPKPEMIGHTRNSAKTTMNGTTNSEPEFQSRLYQGDRATLFSRATLAMMFCPVLYSGLGDLISLMVEVRTCSIACLELT
jgi:hypothetical protein